MEQTRELQKKILEIVKFIDTLCKEHNITYYLCYGSALGAIRHKGFIPWDDDFDIMMDMENYQRFTELFADNSYDNYVLQNQKSDKNYYLLFGKVRDISTTYIECDNVDRDIMYGVFVDIFPLVGVPNNKWQRTMQKTQRAFVMSTYINVINSKKLKKLYDLIVHIFGKKRVRKFGYRGCVKYPFATHDLCCNIFDGDSYELNTFPKAYLGTPLYVPYEDTLLPVPQNYDDYLSGIYGDYMRIPSPENRKLHDVYFMDLKTPYIEYIKEGKFKR